MSKLYKNRIRIFRLLLMLYLIVSGAVIFMQLRQGHIFKTEMKSYVDQLNFEDRLLNAKEWVLGPNESRDKRIQADEHLMLASEALTQERNLSVILALFALLFLLVGTIGFKGDLHEARFRAITLVVISFSCLIVGVMLPMMEMGAFSENLVIPIKGTIPLIDFEVDLSREFAGRMYYYYQSKSIADLIYMLFHSGNYVVGIAILSFSVLLPVVKLGLTTLQLLNKKYRHHSKLYAFVSYIGKWSMADVFVVGCFLAYLSFYNMKPGNTDKIDTEVATLAGMYYFLAYCVLSIISSTFLGKAIKKELELEKEIPENN